MPAPQISSSRPVPPDALIALGDEIAALVRAGIPLEIGLGSIGTSPSRAAERLTARIADDLRRGASLPDALEARGNGVPRVFRAVVAAGLRTGRLPQALEMLAEFSRAVRDLRRQIGLALIYPGIIVLIAYGMFVYLLATAGAAMADLQRSTLAPPRWWSEAIVGLNDSLGAWGWIPPVAFALLLLWFALGRRPLVPRTAVGRAGMRLVPWMTGVVGNFQRANFAELAAILVEHEVPLDEALTLAGDASGDRRLGAAARRVAAEVRGGRPLWDALRAERAVLPFMRWMIAAGAQQGALPAALRQLGELYRRRAALKAEWLRLVVPALLAVAIGGTAVLLYTLAVFVPMTDLLRDLAVE